MEGLIYKIFRYEFPDIRYFYKDEGYSLDEVISPRGLLPIFVEQAQCMANVLGPDQLRGVHGVTDARTLTGRHVYFDDDALPQLIMAFVLDAGHLARAETLKANPDQQDIMIVDKISPPIVPSCYTLFSNPEPKVAVLKPGM